MDSVGGSDSWGTGLVYIRAINTSLGSNNITKNINWNKIETIIKLTVNKLQNLIT